MAKFSWYLDKIIYCGDTGSTDVWVAVSPTSGDELEDGPKITVTKPAEKETDCQTATVILSLSNGEKEYINVSRCVPECKCNDVTDNFTATTVEYNTTEIKLGTIKLREDCLKYLNIKTDGVVLCNISSAKTSTNTYSFSATVNTNETIDSRNGFYRILFKGEACGNTHEVTQSGKPYPEGCCSANTSSAVTRESTVYEFGANGGEGIIGIFVITGGTCNSGNRECWVRTDISSDSNWISIGETTTASTTAPSEQAAKKYTTAITVAKNNSGISGREGVITSTFYNAVRGEFVLKKTTIKQTYVPRCGCEESVMNLVLNSNIPASGFPSTHRIGTISFGGCKPESSRLSVEKVGSADWASLSPLYPETNGTYSILAVVNKNTTYAKREATIVVKIDDVECSRGLIKQNEPSKPLCTCDDLDNNAITINGNQNVDGNEQVEVQIATFSVKYKPVGSTQQAGTCDIDKIDSVPLCGNAWVKDVRTEITGTTDIDREGYSYKKGKITAHVLGNDTDSDRECELALFINSGRTTMPCNAKGTGKFKQKKKSEQPTYDILVTLNINNTKYGGIHYSGNRYGFAMGRIDFTVANEDGTDEEEFSVIIANMLICGEITRQYVPINSRYIGDEETKKYFKKIVIFGAMYPNGEGVPINTNCENCNKNYIDEDATFNLTML